MKEISFALLTPGPVREVKSYNEKIGHVKRLVAFKPLKSQVLSQLFILKRIVRERQRSQEEINEVTRMTNEESSKPL